MARLRRRLRAYVVSWMLVQAGALVSLVPQDCCAAHRPAEQEAPCPMHRSAEPEDTCVFRGTCDGPMAALAVWLPQPGLFSEAFVTVPDLRTLAGNDPAPENLVTRQTPPDTPPPRA
jgi:hypothetical protein